MEARSQDENSTSEIAKRSVACPAVLTAYTAAECPSVAIAVRQEACLSLEASGDLPAWTPFQGQVCPSASEEVFFFCRRTTDEYNTLSGILGRGGHASSGVSCPGKVRTIKNRHTGLVRVCHAGVRPSGGKADAGDLKSPARKGVWVRIPSRPLCASGEGLAGAGRRTSAVADDLLEVLYGQ